MRKPRDIDAELKALADKAKGLKAKRVLQLGELVTVTGADALDLETLAGALIAAVNGAKSPEQKEAWRSEGAAFFQRRGRKRPLGRSSCEVRQRGRRWVERRRRSGALNPPAPAPIREPGSCRRRERTRHLIELGGLIQKAGLVDLTDDDRATILGRSDGPSQTGSRATVARGWASCCSGGGGLRAFEAEATGRRMSRLLRLVAPTSPTSSGGYLIGFMVGRLVLIPVFAVAHVDKTFESVITIAAGVVGAISGLGWFNAKFALPAPRGGVHGSAHFASADQIKSALGGAAGLIVGRENRKGGQLLRYAGQAHLLTHRPDPLGQGRGRQSSPTF